MFETYEEADELRYLCPTCGKNKLTILVHRQIHTPTYYTLERCELEGCMVHCLGHDTIVVLDDACRDHREMVSFFQ